MKILRFFFILLILYFNVAVAQKANVVETKETLNGMLQNCLVVEIYDCEPGMVEKEWKNEMKKYKGKVMVRKNTINSENVLIQIIHLNNMNAAANVVKTVNGSKFSVSFDLADKDFLSTEKYPDQIQAAKQFVYDFAIKLRKTKVMKNLSDSKTDLMQKQKDHEQLVRDKDGLRQNIQKYKEMIVQKENEIGQNELHQENKLKEIENQKLVVEKIQK
ncbi:MAG: hypothetical protein COC01_09685, partial [Bacteroidetes bacterium]